MGDAIIYGTIAGGVFGGLAVLFMAIFMKPKHCPNCGTPPPKARKPANRRQMLWGGWTCQCGWELDRRSRKVEEEKE